MSEYRVCWSASTNINFRGASEWTPWDDDEATEDEIHEALDGGSGGVCDGLEEVLNASGFEWWVEVR